MSLEAIKIMNTSTTFTKAVLYWNFFKKMWNRDKDFLDVGKFFDPTGSTKARQVVDFTSLLDLEAKTPVLKPAKTFFNWNP